MRYPKTLQEGAGTILSSFPVIILTFFISYLDAQSIDLSLPRIHDELNLSMPTIQWLASITSLITAATVIPLSRVSEYLGYVVTFQISMIFILIIQMLYFISSSFPIMMLERLFLGVALAGMSSSRAIMYRVLPSTTHQRVYIQQTIVFTQIISLFTPLIAGSIIQYLYYKYNYVIMAFCALSCSIFLVFYKNNKSTKKQKLDVVGALALIVSIGMLCLTFSFLSSESQWASIISFAIFLITIFVFIYTEKNAQNPIIPKLVMKNPLIDMFLLDFINNVLLSALNYILPQYSQLINQPSTFSGMIFTILAVFNVLISIFIPLIQKKIVNCIILIVNLVLLLISSIALYFTSNDKLAFYVFYCICSICCQITYNIVYPLALMTVDRRNYSKISAIPTVCRTLGHSVSLSLFSMVQQLIVKYYQGNNAQLFGYQICFLLFVPFTLISLILVWFRIGVSRDEQGKIGFRNRFIRELINEEDDEDEQLVN